MASATISITAADLNFGSVLFDRHDRADQAQVMLQTADYTIVVYLYAESPAHVAARLRVLADEVDAAAPTVRDFRTAQAVSA